jgi:hypothetical protein
MTESSKDWNKRLSREGLVVADETNFFMRDAEQGCGLLVSNVGDTPAQFVEIADGFNHRAHTGIRKTEATVTLADYEADGHCRKSERDWPDDLNWYSMEIEPNLVAYQVTIGCSKCESRSTMMLNVIAGVSLNGFGFQCERHGYLGSKAHVEDDLPRAKGKTYRNGLKCRKVTAGKMRNHAMATPPGDRLMDYLNRAAAKQREDMKVKVKA